jgi:hypothetical protein
MNDGKIIICTAVRVYVKYTEIMLKRMTKTKLVLLGVEVLYHYMNLNQ